MFWHTQWFFSTLMLIILKSKSGWQKPSSPKTIAVSMIMATFRKSFYRTSLMRSSPTRSRWKMKLRRPFWLHLLDLVLQVPSPALEETSKEKLIWCSLMEWLRKLRLVRDGIWWIGELTMFLQALFRTLMRSQRKGAKSGDQFFSASHFIHVRPMFEVAWIAFLAGLSGPLQDRRPRSSGIMSGRVQEFYQDRVLFWLGAPAKCICHNSR